MKREIDPYTIRKGDLIRWEHEDEMAQFIAKTDQPPYKAWGKYYLVQPAMLSVPVAAIEELQRAGEPHIKGEPLRDHAARLFNAIDKLLQSVDRATF